MVGTRVNWIIYVYFTGKYTLFNSLIVGSVFLELLTFSGEVRNLDC